MLIKVPLKKGRPSKKNTGTLGKTELLQFRLEPKSRFAIELIARYLKRSISSAINIAVDTYSQNFRIKLHNNKIQLFTQEADSEFPLMELVDQVWHDDEATRLINLAQRAQNLLSPEERVIWDLIQTEPVFWRMSPKSQKLEIYVEFIQKIWGKLLNADLSNSNWAEEIDIANELISMQATKDVKKIEALRKALDDLYSVNNSNNDVSV